MRERRLEQRRDQTRQALILNAPRAVQTILEAIKGATRKGEEAWSIRTQNARWLVEQAIGQADQHIEHTSRGEFSRRVDELLAEMEAHEQAEGPH